MKTCLIVDDSRVIRKVARRILEDLGFEVSEASDGMEAMAWCRTSMPQGILLDWNMPMMDGLTFLRELRKEPDGHEPVVVFCTVENDLEHIGAALDAGADEYVMKPFDGDILAAKLAEAGLVGMNPDELKAITNLVRARSGVVVDPDKTYQIETRLAPVARRAGFPGLAELAQAIITQNDEKLIWAVTEALTSGETCFFRDREPFRLFREYILPELAARRGEKPIRIWSAACAAGQEPYSLAMCVEAEQSKYPNTRIEIYGSDISERALDKARSGLYTQFEVQRGLPIRHLVRYFEKADEMWSLSPRIRQMVRWRRVNLLADLTALGQFDVIFCRYVVGSFDDPTRRRVLDQLARLMPPDGRLVLGEGETAVGATDALTAVSGKPGLFAPRSISVAA